MTDTKRAVLTASSAWRAAHDAWQARPSSARLADLKIAERELSAALRAARESAR